MQNNGILNTSEILKYGNNVVQSVVKDVKLDGACQTIDTSIYINKKLQSTATNIVIL